MRPGLLCLLVLALSSLVWGKTSSHHHLHFRRPHFRHRRARFVVVNSPLRGNRDSLLRQNEHIDQDNLPRIKDEAELQELEASNELVPLPENRIVSVARNLPEPRRYCRPWTRQFLLDLGEESDSHFGRGIQVNSAVRTVEVQHKLIRRNRNAAAESGELASPHLSGATIDIAKRGMSRKQLAWMRIYLLDVQNRGVIDVEEEFRQSVFHITVYPEYGGNHWQFARRDAAPSLFLAVPAPGGLVWPELVPLSLTPPELAEPEPAPSEPTAAPLPASAAEPSSSDE